MKGNGQLTGPLEQYTQPEGSVYEISNLSSYSHALVDSQVTHPEVHIVWKSILQFCFPSADFSSLLPPASSLAFSLDTKESEHDRNAYFKSLWHTVIAGM